VTTLRELKHKYSGQAIPQWELDRLEAEQKPEEPARKRRQQPKPDVTDGDSD
jgi:hypothetical protein